MFRLTLAALLGMMSLVAAAQQPAQVQWRAALSDQTEGVPPHISQALQKLNANLVADHVGPAPFAGFYEVLTSGQVLYISEDGRYLMQGTPYDIVNGRSVPSEKLAAYKKKVLDALPQADSIVFAAPNAKHTLRVFTDTTCGFCRRLHQDMAELNQLGITVEYFAFPRGGATPGNEGFDELVSVWCADDRNTAMTVAKSGGQVERKTCANPVQDHYELGNQLGVSGTPAVFAEDGTQLGGYMPPAQFKAALDGTSAGGSR